MKRVMFYIKIKKLIIISVKKKYIQNLHSGEREAEANVNSNHSDLILLPVVFSK